MSESTKISTNGIMWTVGIALTLFIWALQLLGIADNLILGCVLLGIALLLLIISFWRWETALAVPSGFRALIIVLFVTIYLGVSMAIVSKRYSDHSKRAISVNPAILVANTSTLSEPRPKGGQQPPAPSSNVPQTGQPDASLKRSSPLHSSKKVRLPNTNPSETPASVQPSTLNCPNGICIGGDNYGSPQVFNAPQPIAFTADQLQEIGEGMTTFAGRKVEIATDGINDETIGLSMSLKTALEKAGLTVKVEPSMMTIMPGGRRPPPGFSFEFSQDQYDAAARLAAILSTSGFIRPGKGIHAQPDQRQGTFLIYVGSTTH